MKLLRPIGILLTVICFFAVTSVQCEVPAAEKEAETESTSPGYPIRIQSQWNKVRHDLDLGLITRAVEDLNELQRLRLEGGYRALSDYSLSLLASARQSWQMGNAADSFLLADWAKRLSPEVSDVLIGRIPFAHRRGGIKESFGELLGVLAAIKEQPSSLIEALLFVVPSILWSFTLGLYLIVGFLLIKNLPDLVRQAARRLPVRTRGIWAPIVIGLYLCLPVFFGPIVALAVWAFGLIFLLSEKKRISWCVLVLLCFWTALIPAHQWVARWSEQPGIELLLRASSGNFGRSDLGALIQLSNERPNDGAVAYMLALLLRKHGDYPGSIRELERASSLLGREPYTQAQLGIIHYLEGRIEEAGKFYEEAEARGLHSAEFYLNFSKVKFEQMDVAASREYSRKALELKPLLVEEMGEREELVGLRDQSALAEIALPPFFLVRHSLFAETLSEEKDTPHRESIWSFPLPLNNYYAYGVLTGVLGLFLLFSAPSPTNTKRSSSYYQRYRAPKMLKVLSTLIPGSQLGQRGKIFTAWILASVLCFLTLEALQWPLPYGGGFRSLSGYHSFLIASILCFWSASFLSGRVLNRLRR